jgi:hypothetical protein
MSWTADGNGIETYSPTPTGDAGQNINANFTQISALITAANAAITTANTAVTALQSAVTSLTSTVSGKAAKATSPTNGNAANVDGSGNVVDSGVTLASKANASTVTTNASTMNAHIAATGTAVHGLGSASTHASTDFDSAGSASTVATNLSTHAALTSTAHGATSSNTPSTIVARDSSGNFSAGTITGSLTGHASLDLPLTGGVVTGGITANGLSTNRPDSSGYASLSIQTAGVQDYFIAEFPDGLLHIGSQLAPTLGLFVGSGGGITTGGGNTLDDGSGNMTTGNLHISSGKSLTFADNSCSLVVSGTLDINGSVISDAGLGQIYQAGVLRMGAIQNVNTLTFSDSTVQSTAYTGVPALWSVLTAGGNNAENNPIYFDNASFIQADGSGNITLTGNSFTIGSGNANVPTLVVTGSGIDLQNTASITFPDSTTQTTAYTGVVNFPLNVEPSEVLFSYPLYANALMVLDSNCNATLIGYNGGTPSGTIGFNSSTYVPEITGGLRLSGGNFAMNDNSGSGGGTFSMDGGSLTVDSSGSSISNGGMGGNIAINAGSNAINLFGNLYINGSMGFTGSGNYSSFNVVNGIITSAS